MEINFCTFLDIGEVSNRLLSVDVLLFLTPEDASIGVISLAPGFPQSVEQISQDDRQRDCGKNDGQRRDGYGGGQGYRARPCRPGMASTVAPFRS
jgi:hypothetical protein